MLRQPPICEVSNEKTIVNLKEIKGVTKSIHSRFYGLQYVYNRTYIPDLMYLILNTVQEGGKIDIGVIYPQFFTQTVPANIDRPDTLAG